MAINTAPVRTTAARLTRAHEGEFFETTGDIVRIIVSGSQTDGQFALGELSATAGYGPPPHVHPFHEFFYVTEGEIEFGIGDNGVWTTAVKGPGTLVFVPSMAPHCFRGVAPESRFFGIVWDATLEGFFREAGIPRAGWHERGGFDESRMPLVLASMRRNRMELIDPEHPPTGDPVVISAEADLKPQRFLNEVVRFGLRGSQGFGTTAAVVTQLPGPSTPLISYAAAKTLIVIDGEFEITSRAQGVNQTCRATAGDALFAPARAAHCYRNILDQPGRLLSIIHPDGPEGLEGFIDAVSHVPTDSTSELAVKSDSELFEESAALRPVMEHFGMQVQL